MPRVISSLALPQSIGVYLSLGTSSHRNYRIQEVAAHFSVCIVLILCYEPTEYGGVMNLFYILFG